jgi:lytic murein transglycosylase
LWSVRWPDEQQPTFDRCIASIRSSRSARRITERTWEKAAPFLERVGRVIEQLDAQPEFRLPVWDYLAVMADDERIADGQRLLKEESALFTRIERRYGVDKYIIAAVWGIESNFGRGQGGYSVLRSLATLSCEGRRQTYFQRELLSALRIVQSGNIAAEDFKGSWAGAFGQVQFMPGSFERLAVDGDRDGRRDIIGSRADALASAANYLRNAGWRGGRSWGVEVRVPESRRALIGARGGWRRARRTLRAWGALGLRRADGAALSGETQAGLFAPAGPTGPVFLVTRDFEAVYRYNAAESYTLAVAHLSDRLRGRGSLATAWRRTTRLARRDDELRSFLRPRTRHSARRRAPAGADTGGGQGRAAATGPRGDGTAGAETARGPSQSLITAAHIDGESEVIQLPAFRGHARTIASPIRPIMRCASFSIP